MNMRNLPRPGEIIQGLCLDPLGLSVTDAAEILGVSRKALSSILNGRSIISSGQLMPRSRCAAFLRAVAFAYYAIYGFLNLMLFSFLVCQRSH